jgi:hypothetical protein
MAWLRRYGSGAPVRPEVAGGAPEPATELIHIAQAGLSVGSRVGHFRGNILDFPSLAMASGITARL